MKIDGKIGREEWDVILDTINDLPSAKLHPDLDIKNIYENGLAKYRFPGLWKD